jgi:hypothetical protein
MKHCKWYAVIATKREVWVSVETGRKDAENLLNMLY